MKIRVFANPGNETRETLPGQTQSMYLARLALAQLLGFVFK